MAKSNGTRVVRTALQAGQNSARPPFSLVSILDCISDSVICCDGDGRITLFNRAALELLNYDAENVIGLQVERVLPNLFRSLGQDPNSTFYDVEAMGGSGVTVSVQVTADPVPSGGDKCFNFVVRPRESQVKTPREAAWLAAIVESSDDAIIGKRLDGVITTWNKGAERIFGYTAAEIIGQHISKLIPPERSDEESKIQERLRIGDRVDHFDTIRVAKDGRRVEVSLTISPIRDDTGQIIGASKIARDVTERNRAAAARELAEQRMRLAVEAAHIGFWDWDLKSGKIIRSPHYAQMMGTTELEAVRDPALPNFHPDDRAAIDATVAEALKSRADFHIEYRMLWPDGTIRWLEGRGRAMYDEQGAPFRMLGSVIDITDRKRNEELTRVRDAELAHLSRISTMGNMASGLAHELNQPLGAILNYTGVCANLLNANPVTSEKLKAVLDEISGETRRAGAIISRLRSFVTKQGPKAVQIDLNELVRKSISFMDFELRHHGVSVNLGIAKGLPLVLADSIQIEQVLVNLIYNAIQAMIATPPAQKVLTIETSITEDKMTAVSVADTGHGMSPENLARLFEPFFTTKVQGLGMGLNISRSIVENHGGRLSARTNPGGGMRFTFTLPTK